jgi:predicted O-linked N-acetylglucosamine transferase (SPINDLY family)
MIRLSDTELTPASAIKRALECQQAGDWNGAEALYRSILDAYPRHFDALHHLGILKARSGIVQEALQFFSEALRVNARSAEAHLNLGHVLAEAGRAEDALASYDRALALRPRFAEALYGQGNALQRLGRHEEALARYDRALAIAPGRPEILANRGNALHDLKRYGEALASYDRALAVMPGAALLHINRANSLRELKRPEEALASLDRALAIAPQDVDALNNRGNILLDLRRYEDALGSFDRAMAMSPGDAVVHYNRGYALQLLKRYEAALASYDVALSMDPRMGDALYGRGHAQYKLERYEEAVACFEKALAVSPEFEYGTGTLADARMRCCAWGARTGEIEDLVRDVRAGKKSAPPFVFLRMSDSPQDQLSCSRMWVRDKCPVSPTPLWSGERYRHDRIRLAYLSADFRVHPTSFLIAGMLEQHDRGRFETIALSFGDDDQSEIRTRVQGAVDRFIDVRGKGDSEAARLMRDLEVDIAIDLMGHTQYSRMGILALRPAPVQVNYLGYPGTMGADFVDYILADRVVIPEGHRGSYTEKVAYLPDTYQVNDSSRVIADRTPSRAAAGLPEGGIVFCSFNSSDKINPMIFDLWMRLLSNVDGSVLWLLESNAAAARNLRKEAAARGVAPGRLVFAPFVKLDDHLARHRLADLFLDTLPYNAHTTASDALWAGLPVLTCLGTAFPGRVAASLLNAIGLNELVTPSLADYESLALRLARNPTYLADIKSKLSVNRGTFPLFDTDRFRRHVEAAYTTMWERYQRGERPESFAVQPMAG